MVAAGIMLSRLLGLVRQRVFGHFLGTSAAADAFNAAFRIPNLLQNLFGEGVLSASFIPVYARLLADGDEREADRVAGAVASLLALTTSIIVLVGVLATPVLITLIAPGFEGEKRLQTIRMVRILFPGAGLLAMSAWCLGVLNSHRRFFLSYAAPVVWNIAIITALLWFGGRTGSYDLAAATAWASVVGSGLQFAVQLPVVLSVARHLRLNLDTASRHVRTVIRNFVPVFLGRGVYQVSSYVDMVLGSALPTGAVAGLGYAQTLYLLPVSLFGMSVSAAELPAMSSGRSGEDQSAFLARRLNTGLRQIAFFVVPSAMAFLVLGDVVAGAVYQSGVFTRDVTLYVWAILAGSGVGLLASTLSRLYSSAYYALGDTTTPLRYAMVRVGLTLVLGYLFAFPLPALLHIAPRWGAAGLTASAGIASWVEFTLLRRSMNGRIGTTGLAVRFTMGLWAAALVAAATARGVQHLIPLAGPIPVAMVVLGTYGFLYLALGYGLGGPELRGLIRRTLLRRA